jgi:hypothetical protein
MVIDLTVPKSRRAVLAAVFGGMAAAAANAVARPASALATDGQPILQGVDNGGSASTVVRSNSTTALQGVSDVASGAHYGVRGRSSSSSGIGTVGVAAAAAGGTIGVHGTAVSLGGVGVKGESPRHGVEGYATNTTDITAGVYGHAVSPQGIAVLAQNDANSTSAIAVHGRASGYGVFGLGFGNAVGVRGAPMARAGRLASGATSIPSPASECWGRTTMQASSPAAWSESLPAGSGSRVGRAAWSRRRRWPRPGCSGNATSTSPRSARSGSVPAEPVSAG